MSSAIEKLEEARMIVAEECTLYAGGQYFDPGMVRIFERMDSLIAEERNGSGEVDRALEPDDLVAYHEDYPESWHFGRRVWVERNRPTCNHQMIMRAAEVKRLLEKAKGE
jgi:hypothetical protein